MIGAIAGDVIGSIYEREPIKTVDFPLFQFGCRFTDDTVLSVAVAESLLTGKPYAKLYEDWYYRFPNAGYGGTFHKWASSHDHQPYNSWGNGSAMRVGPVGLAFATMEETLEAAKRSAEVTHDHPEGIKGAQAVAVALFLIRSGKPKAKIAEHISVQFGYDVSQSIDSVRPKYQFDVSCQGTVPHAIRAFLEGNSFEETVRLAVSLGGDSDTLACIAGGLAEAYYGVPLEIIQSARRYLSDSLLEVVDAFQAKYWPALRPEYFTTKFIVEQQPAILPDEFVIVTACNPEGRNLSADENDSKHKQFLADIQSRNLKCWPVAGCSPDLIHKEQGLAVVTHLETGLKFGRDYRQEAVYFVENGELFLVNCASGQRFVIGPWRERFV